MRSSATATASTWAIDATADTSGPAKAHSSETLFGAAELITLRAAPSSPPPATIITTTVVGPGGIVVIDTNGAATYPLPNAHGDIAATTDGTAALTGNPTVDEYGKPTTAGTATNRLGWHGNDQRYTVAANGTIRMGVRLYDPNLGRFLSVDPIDGGSCNDYDYVCGDPINMIDLDGEAAMIAIPAGYGGYLGGVVVVGGIGWVLSGGHRKVTIPKISLPKIRFPRFHFAKRSKSSGKEKASDAPSWLDRSKARRLPGESPDEAARRVLDERYGRGEYGTGPKSEFNKVKKWISRN